MIEVREITDDPQLILESLRCNYEEWGPPLSLEAYVEREYQLDAQITGAGLQHRTFALLDEQRVLGACEVLSRPLYYGGGLDGRDHCFASVFVAPEHRGRGYAERLVTEVVEQVTDRGDQASLWSDIGTYYTRCGFHTPGEGAPPDTPPSWERSLICDPARSARDARVKFEWIDEQHMDQLIQEHRRVLCRAADVLYHEAEGEVEYAVVVPHCGLYAQLQHRGVFSAKALHLEIPIRFGARTANGHGWMAWAYMFSSKTLLVIGVFGSANEVAELFAAAAEAARAYAGFKVEMFESTLVGSELDFTEMHAALSGHGLKAELVPRPKSLPMSTGNAVWVYPGGYAWY